MANLQAVGTIAARAMQARRNPIARGLAKGAFTFGKKLGHVLHLLFLEVTGMLFIAVALGLGGAAYREWVHYAGGDHSSNTTFKLGVAAVMTAMFLYFGVSSFFRANRKAKKTAAKTR